MKLAFKFSAAMATLGAGIEAFGVIPKGDLDALPEDRVQIWRRLKQPVWVPILVSFGVSAACS